MRGAPGGRKSAAVEAFAAEDAAARASEEGEGAIAEEKRRARGRRESAAVEAFAAEDAAASEEGEGATAEKKRR
ncbi:hypothetical protein AB6A40_011498 [Gnathostoma spinigerum]|uniref:Uncharacterized protein n=1 Tax=Gnathostoma spinigerum TaxID=75299 RepID=A0ABD6F1V8_9BILA